MLNELKKRYKQALTAKIEAIRVHLGEFRKGDHDAEKKLRNLAHSLHGSGTTYGYPDISTAAKAVEHAEKKLFLKKLTVLITVLQDVADLPEADPVIDTEPVGQENKILIIEDDTDISALLDHVLTEKFTDYDILISATALDAVNAIKLTRYSLIILDLVLPDCDGRELLKTIKSGHNRDAPVFVLSGMNNDIIQADCLQMGASHFFNKPFDPDIIADEIEALFRGRETGASLAAVADSINVPQIKKAHSGRLLLAEDDELLARIIIHRLSREKLTVDHYFSKNGGQQYLRAEHNHRFDAHDTMVEAGLLLNQNGSLPLEVAVGYTGSADFMPETLLRLGTSHVLHQGTGNIGTTVLTGQYQLSQYGNGDVRRVLIGLEYYLLGANAWLTPSIGSVRDQDNVDTFAWTLGAHWQMSANTRVGMSYSDAPETENQITTNTRNYQAYLQRVLDDNVSLILNLSRHERENSYTRENISLSLQYHF